MIRLLQEILDSSCIAADYKVVTHTVEETRVCHALRETLRSKERNSDANIWGLV